MLRMLLNILSYKYTFLHPFESYIIFLLHPNQPTVLSFWDLHVGEGLGRIIACTYV